MTHELTRHASEHGPRWAADGRWLPASFRLADLLALQAAAMETALRQQTGSIPAAGPLLAPLDADHEVWASGVTYLSSRLAREAESESSADVYHKVYHAARPELFFKASGWRVVGHRQPIRIRRDSRWNVPEPELVLVLNSDGEIVGHSVGNDVSSRSIEGENPLYLPQAKIYDGACAIGPCLRLGAPDRLTDLPIELAILRGTATVYSGASRTSQIKRALAELAGWLFRELSFPGGVLLFTGTGIVPDEGFTLASGDRVHIRIGALELENPVA